MAKLGVCPACKKPIDDFDVEDINFRGTGKNHTAYRCKKCNTIIGFSSS